MRWSKMHIPTLRDDPADAGAPSHRLLLRAGYIRQLMAGHYSLLPLGQRVRLKVIGIIREEMNAIGAQEILMPVMHPAELWRKSGRWELMGDEMFRLKDRRGADLALGMTHEEIVSTLATELESYRELPQLWYQFQTKLRDEPRPKAGLMRTREFTMKDSYSFDLGPDGLDVSFAAHRDAYARIFERLGIPAIQAEASNGTMGGSDSTEFICPVADRRGPDHPLPRLRLRGEHREGHVPAGGDRRFSRTDRAACRSRALRHPGRTHHRPISPSSTRRRPNGRSRPWCTSWTACSPWC